MIEPTAALDRIVEQMIRPLYGRLCAILKALAGPDVGVLAIQRAAKSVVGQCLFYKHCAPVIRRLDGKLPDLRDIDELTHHIVSFSGGGVRALGAAKRKAGAR